MIVFIHMPKTGGFAYRFLLVAKFGEDRVLDIVNKEQMSAYLQSSPRAPYDALCGHMPYGVHRHVEEPCEYYVMLREPVDRLVSDYYYIARSPQHPLHAQIQQGMTLLEFAQRPQEHNQQATRLSYHDLTKLGPNDPGWFNKKCDKAIFDDAKETLFNQIRNFGIYERFTQSAHHFCDLIDYVPPRQIPYYNAAPDRPSVDALDPGVRAAIQEWNSFDVELYNLAYREFSQNSVFQKAAARTDFQVNGPRVDGAPSSNGTDATLPGIRTAKG